MKLCLIVDDSEIVRKYSRLIFESLDYRTIESDTTSGALDRLAGETPHVILADWRIPGCNTHEFIAQVRRMNLLRRPYIIYLATENDAADFERATVSGADNFLLKPFNRDIIEMKLLEIRAAA
ncbi:MAG TPA: response regulator [Hyphomicrobium sp.]|nr:response regulator [Hyphomicrobium sp.]